MKIWIKLDRLAAWILFFGMTLYFISGYGMTKGIFDESLASKIHLDWLSIIIILAFVLHAGFATRLALIRWRAWQWPSKFIWAAFFFSFLLGFIFLDQFYQPNYKQNESATDNGQSSMINAATSDTSATSDSISSDSLISNSSDAVSDISDSKVFTATTLAKYNGQNGNPAYLAVDGKVYDLTSVFQNGRHYSHYAGKELTNAFYSYHAARVLAKYPVIGSYQP